MSCQICHNLMPSELGGLESGKRATFFITVSELLSSAKAGTCADCTLLFDVVSLYKSTWPEEEHTRLIEVRVAPGQALELFYRLDILYLDVFRETNRRDCDDAPSSIGELRVACECTSFQQSAELIRPWLLECQTSHKICRALADTRPIPSRVLEIPDHGDHVVLRNIPAGSEGAYVALSYCWGKPPANQALLTTKANLQQHHDGIQLYDLPQTILDAVNLCRSLQYRYIWVDALCIIQDDPAEWEREAANMSDVYFNAALTIIASRAAGTAEGMFGYQDYSDSDLVPYRSGKVRVRKSLAREHATILSLDREPGNYEPINKRAWCLQEVILSNRAVYFTKQETHWLCNEWRKCECGNLSTPISATDWAEYQCIRIEEMFRAQTLEEAYIRWDDIIATFSQRSITYEKDRLPALSGLARRFGSMLGKIRDKDDVYLAGMWQGSFPRSLLWRVGSETVRAQRDADIHHRRAATWRAPSWSWTSVEAHVTVPPLTGLKPLVEIFDWNVQLAGSDPHGQLQAASLSVRGALLQQVIARPTSHMVWNSRQWGLWLDTTSIGTFVPDFEDFHDEHGEFAVCSVLLIGQRKMNGLMSALVVVPTDASRSTYKRIGVADLGPFESRRGQFASHPDAMPSIPRGSKSHVDMTTDEFMQTVPKCEVVLV